MNRQRLAVYRERLAVYGGWLTVYRERLAVHGGWLTVHRERLAVHREPLAGGSERLVVDTGRVSFFWKDFSNNEPAAWIGKSEQKENKMKAVTSTTLIFGVAILLTLIGCDATNQKYDAEQRPMDASPARGLEETNGAANLQILDHSVKTGQYGNRLIVGRIKNNGSKELSYVMVTFSLYDSQNNLVGTALANVNNLEPGATWKFEAGILEDNAVSYKVKEITAF